jgi:hypothetical protein
MYLASNPDSVVYHLELSLNENNNTNTDDVKECSLYGLLGTKGNHDIFHFIFLLSATSDFKNQGQRTKN